MATASTTGPGVPDRRGPARYLWWLVVSQPKRVALGAVLGSAWMVGLTLPPYVLSRAIDDGLRPGDEGALIGWTAALFIVGILDAWLGIMRHRTMTRIRLDAYFRTVRVVMDHATRLGAALPRRVSAGEVVTIGHSDVGVIGSTLTVTGPGVGAVIAYAVVAALLLSFSVLLAIVVLLGVPLLALFVGPFLSRLQGAETAYRERQGALAGVLGDLAAGLRVLNGLGGKQVFAARYRAGSRELRDEGHRVGSSMSWIQAFGIGLPSVFLAAVTWLAARMAAQGAITVGELVAVYGYVAVLVVPVSSFLESGYDISRGLVSARRVVDFLNLAPETWSAVPTSGGKSGTVALGASGEAPGVGEHALGVREATVGAPEAPAVLHDHLSGVKVEPGILTALASTRTSEATEVVDRLGRFTLGSVTWGAVRLDAVPLEQVRARILVADNEAALFAGTLRAALSGRLAPDEDALTHAVEAAAARDIVLGLPDGFDARLDAHGHNLSGGQRQRVRLARALLADPEVLLAVEPTSAVDAHTEAKMAAGLRAARAERTTLVTTTSPLVLDQADVVYHLVDGRVSAVGSHAGLLARHPDYRRLVSRDTEEATTAGATDVTEATEMRGSTGTDMHPTTDVAEKEAATAADAEQGRPDDRENSRPCSPEPTHGTLR
ncbi:ABC transporter [Streptomyces alfalfae]|uniref:ABC transporter ATP-binding protein n=1 Tax=Streptomyces alfalfae TaxID=1642299 RepID=UPI001010677A|nr:ABC transporter ATP-binding protein [Streptomyces alfalfae]RXX43580.1 ABC transporter [Streptomyces alfalfae]RZN01444.1 ABC transporter ATP-binding protein [Streptomyces alfalfae]